MSSFELEILVNCFTKEELRVQREQITHLKQQLWAVNAALQARRELAASQDEKLAELRAQNEGLVAKLQRSHQRLARIREEAEPSPEFEGMARVGASRMKRAWIPEGRNDTECSARASKRPKKPSERSDRMESTVLSSEDEVDIDSKNDGARRRAERVVPGSRGF
jgi:hypothetical protein